MEKEQKKFEEVTLYNFVSMRSPQNREKDDEDMKIDFIYCDLIFDNKDKKLKSDEVAKINEIKEEIIYFDDLYGNLPPNLSELNDHFMKIIDFGKTLNEYRYKDINFYKIHKELLKVEYTDENLVIEIKRITWKTLIRITKSGGELKLKQALINILRIFHLKKNVKLISDPEYREDIPFFKRLIDAQVVIPKELFPKEETFFFGERIKQFQVDPKTIKRVGINNKILSLKNLIEKFNFDDAKKEQLKTELDFNSGIRSTIKESISNDIYKTPFFTKLLIQESKGFLTINFDEIYFSKTKKIIEIEITLIKDTIFKIDKKTDNVRDAGASFDLKDGEVNKVISTNSDDILLKGKITLLNNFTYFFEITLNRSNPSIQAGILDYSNDGVLIIDDSNDFYGQAFAPSGYGVKQLGILEYRRVVSTISRYVPAEVSKIENVMASEYRELATVKELTKEVTDFESTEESTEKENESVSTDRFQMQNEISKIFEDQKTDKFDSKFSYGADSTKLEISYGTSTVNSKTESNKQAITTAKEVTNKAVEKVFTKVRKERTVKVTERFTESNKHGFDNRGNTNHVSGVYRHINAVYRNQIQNYGRRLLYEFAIPEPALFHRLAILQDDNLSKLIKNLPKPPVLEEQGIKGYSDITEETDLDFLSKLFEVKGLLPLPVKNQKVLDNEHFSIGSNDFHNPTEFSFLEYPPSSDIRRNIVLNDGYHPKFFDYQFFGRNESEPFTEFNTAPGLNGVIFLVIGDRKIEIGSLSGGDSVSKSAINQQISFNSNSKFLDWYIIANDIHALNFKISINIEIDENYKVQVQKNNYDILKRKSEELSNDYFTALKKIIEDNPIVDKYQETDKAYIQNISLRKQCISYLIRDDPKNLLRKMGQDMYEKDTRNDLKKLKIHLSSQLNEYTAFARFLEQAFDWNMMSYSYYPFYWADEDEWKLLYNLYDDNTEFKKFLQAGMARVIVSVKLGFEKAVMQYMLTGKIWEGGDVPTYGSSMFLSIAAELKEDPNYTIEGTWETVLPTNLIALQKSGVAIDQEGLPNLEFSQDLGNMVEGSSKFPKRKKFLGIF